MRKLRLKKVKGLTMVLKNLISGIWRASVNPKSFGAQWAAKSKSHVRGTAGPAVVKQPSAK